MWRTLINRTRVCVLNLILEILCCHAAVDALIHLIILFFSLLCCRFSYFLPLFPLLTLIFVFFSFFFFFFFFFSSSSKRDVLEIWFVIHLRWSSLWLYYNIEHFRANNFRLIIFESCFVRSWLHRVLHSRKLWLFLYGSYYHLR